MQYFECVNYDQLWMAIKAGPTCNDLCVDRLDGSNVTTSLSYTGLFTNSTDYWVLAGVQSDKVVACQP